MSFLGVLVLFLLVISIHSAAFIVPTNSHKRRCHSARHVLPTPEESAKALTDYMAKSHEDKIKAIATIEAKYKDRIKELEDQVKLLESRSPVQTSQSSYEMPATNKGLAEMVNEYRTFLSNYLINAQKERLLAVATAERKLRDHYEAIIAELQPKQEPDPPVVRKHVTKTESSELAGRGGFE